MSGFPEGFEEQQSRLAVADQRVTDTWLELRAALIDQQTIRMERQDPRLESLARRLFVEKMGGDGEDQPVMAMKTPYISGNGIALLGPFCPAWATYLSEASYMLMSVDAVAHPR